MNAVPATMWAIRAHPALTYEEVETPRPGPGEALVRVHAAAITRDELEWPADRLPAIPSYELSGVVVAGEGAKPGEEVYALADFGRDGAAAEYAVVPGELLAPRPLGLTHVESAAIPLAGLSAWQGLFDHGRLAAGERTLIHGAAGGVGSFAVQLARARGAHVIGTASTPPEVSCSGARRPSCARAEGPYRSPRSPAATASTSSWRRTAGSSSSSPGWQTEASCGPWSTPSFR